MVTIGASEARDEFSELLNRAVYAGERSVITRRGKPVAVLLSAEDFEALERLEDLFDEQLVREADAEDDGTRVPLEELKAELGL